MNSHSGKTVVLHIGLAKTATTYLQRHFVANREWLEDRGVCYPGFGQEYSFGHHNLHNYLRGLELRGADWSGLALEEVVAAMLDSPCPRVLLSCEGLSDLLMEHHQALREALEPHAVQVVVYVRKRSELCASRWQEEVKHGSTRGFCEFLTQQLIHRHGALRIEDAIAIGAHVYGIESLRVVVMNNLVQEGRDVFEFFVTEVLGLDPAGARILPGLRANPSLPDPLIETFRALNCAAEGEQLSLPVPWSSAARQRISSIAEGAALLSEVEDLFEVHGEELDLSLIDLQWLARDQEIIRILGPRILNPRSDSELFVETPTRKIRVLAAHLLHRSVPPSRIAAVCRQIAEEFSG